MSKKLIGLTLALALFAVALPASAASLTQAQISAIIGLLQSFGAEQSVINNVSISLGGGTPGNSGNTVSCVELSYNLFSGSTDNTAGGQVTKLQRFLGVSQTGYFGPATEAAVQRWQAQNGIVSSGSPDSTGYGYVGAKTRAAMARGCEPIVQPGTYTATQSGLTAEFSAEVVSGDWEKLIINFGDGTSGNMKKTVCPGITCFVGASHTYPRAGVYVAQLASKLKPSQVLGTATVTATTDTVSFSATPTYGSAPLFVEFTTNQKSGVFYYDTNAFLASCLPDEAARGACDSSIGPSGWTYKTPGTYTATLTTACPTSQPNCSTTVLGTKTITVTGNSSSQNALKMQFNGYVLPGVENLTKDVAHKLCSMVSVQPSGAPIGTCTWGGSSIVGDGFGIKDGDQKISFLKPAGGENTTISTGSGLYAITINDKSSIKDRYKVYLAQSVNNHTFNRYFEANIQRVERSGSTVYLKWDFTVNGGSTKIPAGAYYFYVVNLDTGEVNTVSAFTYIVNDQNTDVPSMKILSPNGGESYRLDQPLTLKWSAENIPTGASFVVEFRRQGGGEVTRLATADSTARSVTFPSIGEIRGGDLETMNVGAYTVNMWAWANGTELAAKDSSDGMINILQPAGSNPAATIDNSSLSQTRGTFYINGSASNAASLQVIMVTGNYTGATDWNSANAAVRANSVYNVNATARVENGRWVAPFGPGTGAGVPAGTYTLLVYDLSQYHVTPSVLPKLLTRNILTVQY